MTLNGIPLGGVNVQVSHIIGKHPTRKYKERFEVHPIIKWLARFLPIKPFIEVEYSDDADPIYFRDFNTLYVGKRTYEIIKQMSMEQPE